MYVCACVRVCVCCPSQKFKVSEFLSFLHRFKNRWSCNRQLHKKTAGILSHWPPWIHSVPRLGSLDFAHEQPPNVSKCYCDLDRESSRSIAHSTIHHLYTLFCAHTQHPFHMGYRCINAAPQRKWFCSPSSIQTFCSPSRWHREGREHKGSAITAIIRKPLVLPCLNKWKRTHTFVMFHLLLIIIHVEKRKTK